MPGRPGPDGTVAWMPQIPICAPIVAAAAEPGTPLTTGGDLPWLSR